MLWDRRAAGPLFLHSVKWKAACSGSAPIPFSRSEAFELRCRFQINVQSKIQCSRRRTPPEFGAKLRGSWACDDSRLVDQCDSDAATSSDSERTQSSLSHGQRQRHADYCPLKLQHVCGGQSVSQKKEEHPSSWLNSNQLKVNQTSEQDVYYIACSDDIAEVSHFLLWFWNENDWIMIDC